MSSGFRITHRSLGDRSLRNLQSNLGRLGTLQEQLSSGKQLAKPSDSPTGTVSALRHRSDIRRSEQMSRNAEDGLGFLGTADGALTETLAVVRRARELVLQSANDSLGTTEREAIAAEVEGLRENALDLANTSYLGRAVFAGTKEVAYDATGAYRGSTPTDPDGGAVRRRVAPGVDVQVNVLGAEVFGPDGADLFAVLDRVTHHLRGQHPDGTANPGAATDLRTTDLAALDERFVALQNRLATVGARYHQVEMMRDRAEDAVLTATNDLAEVESVDLPKTIMELRMQEVAYESALAATAKALQPSLLDFLR